jgi:hypothetical protein
MDELGNNRLRPHGASGASPGSDANLDADISAAFRGIIYALPQRARDFGWTPDTLRSIHTLLRKKEKALFGEDNFLTECGNPIRWDPTDIITWGRLFGFKEQVHKRIKIPYDKRWRIQKRHFRRMRLVLNELTISVSQALDYSDDIRSSWMLCLNYLHDEIAGRPNAGSPVIPKHDEIDTGARQVACEKSPLEERLSEKLSKINSTRDVASLLVHIDHCYEWSVEFRDAFSLLDRDKRQELAYWFYKTVGSLWQTPDDTLQHVAIMAAGTLTYAASAIEGLKEVGIWNDWLETIIDDLRPEMVLIAEPFSFIASIHGRHGSFVRNIHRMIDIDPSYRRADFAERLHYCNAGQGVATLETKIVSVAKNISRHLHDGRQFPQILCHDVGRVIEVYPRLIEHRQYLDLAEFIKEATIKALANIDIKPSLRARVEDLIELGTDDGAGPNFNS